jgi:hypothetical protein
LRAITLACPTVFSKERFRNATEDESADQDSGADEVPTVFTERNHAKTIQKPNGGHS